MVSSRSSAGSGLSWKTWLSIGKGNTSVSPNVAMLSIAIRNESRIAMCGRGGFYREQAVLVFGVETLFRKPSRQGQLDPARGLLQSVDFRIRPASRNYFELNVFTYRVQRPAGHLRGRSRGTAHAGQHGVETIGCSVLQLVGHVL